MKTKITLNRAEIINLMKELVTHSMIDKQSMIELTTEDATGIGIATYVVINGKQIDITDYDSW